MARACNAELKERLGEEVVIKGWVERIRELSRVDFLLIRDCTGVVQVAAAKELRSAVPISTESVVEIRGKVKEEPRAKAGFEVEACEIVVLSYAEALPFPINGPELNVPLELVLDHRVLSLRHGRINPIFRIQAALVHGFQQFLNREGFVQIFTPKIVASGTEGGTELFTLDYFGEKAYLAQSPQFYKQMMVAAGYERVYEVGQVYRAEKHATSRHLNEYVSLDLELAFIESEHDLMDLQNRLLDFMFSFLEERCSRELEQLGVSLPRVGAIPRISLAEAVALLERHYGKEGLEGDLDPEGECLLSSYFLEQEGTEFVFVTDYPWAKRPMYTMPKAGGLTRSFDLLFRGLEITTGGQRIHAADLLEQNMRRKGLEPQAFASYLQPFTMGMPPHGGLAMGLERLTAQILGLGNIRQAALFPRDRHRLTP